jgi:hypothetical protein
MERFSTDFDTQQHVWTADAVFAAVLSEGLVLAGVVHGDDSG